MIKITLGSKSKVERIPPPVQESVPVPEPPKKKGKK